MSDYVGIDCGVFAAINLDKEAVFPLLYWGLRAQNHRGHQSHGFITYNGQFHVHKALDLVPKISKENVKNWLAKLPGHIGVANVRYTTSGKTDYESLQSGTQPVMAEKDEVKLAVSFNGNVVNTKQLLKEIREVFPGFSYQGDAELICRKLLIELIRQKDLISAVKTCMEEIEGAFSVSGITGEGEIFAFKDSYGIRPLCAGHDRSGRVYAFSSESVGLNINDLILDFELEPGEFVLVSEEGLRRERLIRNGKAFCAFEFAYFARPDSKFDDKYVYEIREEFGRNLARENPDIVKNADLIISMPETGNDAAYGLHEETGLRWERATRRHRFVTERAFILLPHERYKTIDKKINILAEKVKGKRVIIIDDSIVRGDTTRVVVEKLRKMGAEKVYIFVTFPRIIGPCFYGIDMATFSELIGSRHTPEE
ncbi:MAG TPA: hypothetical protein ENG10_02910, partial [Candidatus Bathyarchaeota archaeon]|nr:hypothetical protein [Candidatus Bathyarchaeota archaeon]HEX69226.1 hypothetical protein [Candidatus Bathyarchaeota archaeon]